MHGLLVFVIPSAPVATERGRPAFMGQSQVRSLHSRDGSHRCVQARRPRIQAVRGHAPTSAPQSGGNVAVQGHALCQRARNIPERPWAAPV